MPAKRKTQKEHPNITILNALTLTMVAINTGVTKIGIIIHQPIYYLYFSF
mgnify:CR=1 FL=1